MLPNEPAPPSQTRLAQLDPSVRAHPRPGPIVYYVTNLAAWPVDPDAGGHVAKIGTTVDLPTRTIRYQRSRPRTRLALLAWEPGGPEVEGARHRAFADLRWTRRRDWFYLGTDLLDHVLALRDGRTLEEYLPWV
jgi:hypothetical protein